MKQTDFILCPICNSKTRIKIRSDTVLENFPLFCPKCKQETLINVKQLKVLSSIFRKFDSEKMKLCAGKPGEGAAKPRLIAAEHMTAAVSGAAKPFILTLDSAGGICYLIAALMPLLLRLRSDISYIDTALFPTPFPTHTAVWRKPASEQTFRPGKCRQRGFVSGSHGSCAQ